MDTPLQILDGITVGPGAPLLLIGGPCVIESREHCLRMAGAIRREAESRGLSYVFKASYDKANRTSASSFRGPGPEEGLRILAAVKAETGVPVLSDVHEVAQVEAAARVLDVLQIPAFLCRQTDLITAAAATGRAINIKKGQFLAPEDIEHVLDKARRAGGDRVLVTERGTSFGYHNLVVDFRSLPRIGRFGCPVVFDASHSVQLPAGRGTASGGEAEFIPVLARAAVAVGVDGIFVEIHDRPERALSDGPNALRLDLLPAFLDDLCAIRAARAPRRTPC